MINVVLVGFGGIAQAHRNSYDKLMNQGLPVKLKAACDINPERFVKAAEINLKIENAGKKSVINTYTDLEEMLAKEKPDLVDICLPTPLHAGTAVEMLRRGYHVLSEKPMARTYELCQTMLEAARQAKGQLMIGQCLRFFPQYEYLKSLIDSNEYGPVRSAVFQRLSGSPIWAWENWYMDYDRSGGCLLDMHIHDLDMIRNLFGEPDAVSCRTQNYRSKMDAVQSNFYYPDKPVVAIGDWSLDGTGFYHGFRIGFEQASVIFDSNEVKVYPRDGQAFRVDLPYDQDGILREIAYFISLIESSSANLRNPPQSAALTVRLAESLRDSALQGGARLPFKEALV
jgi:predicted dehydrogenase